MIKYIRSFIVVLKRGGSNSIVVNEKAYNNWLKEHSGRSAGNEPSAWMKNRGIKTSKGVDTKLLRKLKSINKIADRIVNPVTYARGRMD